MQFTFFMATFLPLYLVIIGSTHLSLPLTFQTPSSDPVLRPPPSWSLVPTVLEPSHMQIPEWDEFWCWVNRIPSSISEHSTYATCRSRMCVHWRGLVTSLTPMSLLWRNFWGQLYIFRLCHVLNTCCFRPKCRMKMCVNTIPTIKQTFS